VDLVSGFLIGILGSLHCVGMCGPIALALPMASTGGIRFLGSRVLYNLGRIVTYVVLGALVGSIGGMVAVGGMQQTLSIIIGCTMLVGVILPAASQKLSSRWHVVQTFHSFLRRSLGTLLQHRTFSALFLIGIVNGFLPCGFLYVALAGAATLGNAMRGTIFLAGFGMGTLPLMLGVALAGKQVQGKARKRAAKVVPAFAVVLAALFILRGLNLGIPYISPHMKMTQAPAAGKPAPCHGE